jgi:formylglycine-generating enzyme required for sulfatase activity
MSELETQLKGRGWPMFGVAVFLMMSALGCATSKVAPIGADEGAQAAQRGDAFLPGDTRTVNIPGTDVSFNLVYVPAGRYSIGSPEDEPGRDPDEGPRHEVELSGYWIGQFEVTGTEYSIFRFPDRDADTTAVPGAVYQVDAVSRPSPPYEDPAFGLGGSGKPAVGMTQWGALHYAHWLTEKTGVFFRLPTEAEWETACRAGTDRVYSFGNTPDALSEYAWLEANGEEKLHDVGQKKANDWGVYDMHGNAAEWTMDEYMDDFYGSPEAVARDPWSPPTRLHPRTVRGGSFYDAPADLRCAARLESTLNWKRRDPQIPKSFWWNTDAPFLGFRIVAPESGMTEEEQVEFWKMVLGE